ncbi:MAG: YbcC family protein [Inhella sp.]
MLTSTSADSTARALQVAIDSACEQACAAIAPTWPLDRAIAVNPHWQRTGLPLRRVAARMAVLGGIQLFPPRERQREAWRSGRIQPRDLAQALTTMPAASELQAEDCIAALDRAPALQRLPLLIELLDDDPGGMRRLAWKQAVTHQVSQVCAAYFDTEQADWPAPRDGGLYHCWRDTLRHDHGIGLLMGLPRLGSSLGALPDDREDAERWVMQRLGLPEAVWADYLESVLLTVNGWASWCAYLGWQARQQDGEDPHLRELLAIRLAWGALLLDGIDQAAAAQAFAALQAAWQQAEQRLAQAEAALLVDEVWQRALEIGYQRQLAERLRFAAPPVQAEPAEVQAVFCIDVRSEPMRRALEAAWPAVHTHGFAGFFGLPIAYTPLGTSARRPQLPGLLAPAMEVGDALLPAGSEQVDAVAQAQAADGRRNRLAWSGQWSATTRWPGTAFSFVETLGLAYLAKLAGWLRPQAAERDTPDAAGLPARYRPVCRPMLQGLDLPSRVELAARVLGAMGLTRTDNGSLLLAPLVLLVGHGSQSANNAQAAALDCGACCGQTGEVNARSLALLLNEAAVRDGLAARGLAVPRDTQFVAALHNTTTDEIVGFDLDRLPPTALARWQRLLPVLAQAGDQVRRERAPLLGLDPHRDAAALLRQLRDRASDGAQTRPEWGLAGNAAFLIAPRARSLGVCLDGRSFLHDYDAGLDPDGSLLELLMTAPMLVTHWINWQYHASTCDPLHLGSGNKVLHNVVGGRLGVFEGNGGDLRIGLAQQSLHDGQRWVHEPLRLTVIIDAPAAAIDAVIDRHPVVRQLVVNGWLHLWRFSGESRQLQVYDDGRWQPLAHDQDLAGRAAETIAP